MTLIRDTNPPAYYVDERWRRTSLNGATTYFASPSFKVGQNFYSESSRVVGWEGKLRSHKSATSSRIAKSKSFRLVQPLKVTWTYQPGPGSTTYCVDSVCAQMYSWYSFPGYPASLSHVPLASTRFYKAIYDALNKFESATELAEMHEVAGGLRRLFESIGDLLKSLGTIKKHPFRTLKGVSRGLAGTWLGAQFGLKPLISSSVSLLEQLRAINSREVFIKVRAGAKTLDTLSQGKASLGFPFEGYLTADATVTGTKTKRTRILGEIRVTPRQPVTERFGLDVGSWILAGWEVIPWSFLVDYVIPVGSYIKAMLAQNTELAWVSRTTVEDVLDTVTWSNPVPTFFGENIAKAKVIASTVGVLQASTKFLTRDGGLSVPTLPGIDFSDSPIALVNSVALLIQQQNKWIPALMTRGEYLSTRKRLY